MDPTESRAASGAGPTPAGGRDAEPAGGVGSAPRDSGGGPLVLARVRRRLGHIALNRPGKINALNLEMIAAVRGALTAWRDDPTVAAVLITGAGPRGLCAGGDIAAVYRGIRGEVAAPQGFWVDEYRMNLEIGQYPKPVVTLMHGITFGGGVGIAAHAPLRVVTDGSALAMPETAIGLSPDVGGLYLLSRAPGEIGTYAALTGARLGPGDAMAAGLADFYVPAGDFAGLPDALAGIETADDVSLVLRAHSAAPPPSEFVAANRGWIDACFSGDDARDMPRRLESRTEPAAQQAAATLSGMSPTAVAVTLRAIRRARTMTLAEVLDQDLMLSVRFAAGHDFPEGIRAKIIDKDGAPRWSPATLDAVTPAAVDAFFAPD